MAANPIRKKATFGWLVRLSFLAGVGIIAIGLWLWGAMEVRGHFKEVFLLTMLGFGWLVVSVHLFPWLGLSIGDDVIERENPAALVALCGGALAVAAIYTGGSLGEGPSYWNNIFSAGIGTAGFFMLWIIFEVASRASVGVAEERDFPSGIRLGGFLLSLGLMLGRALAGNWHSQAETVHDFLRDGWPAGALCILAAVIEWFIRPTRQRPFPRWAKNGLLPALVYLGGAVGWVCYLGRWEGMPR